MFLQARKDDTDAIYVNESVYADDDAIANGGEAETAEEATRILNATEEGAEALTIGLMISSVRTQHAKSFLTFSPRAAELLGTPQLRLVALNASGQLIQAPCTTVSTPGNPTAATPEDRGATRYLGAHLSWGGTGTPGSHWDEQNAVITKTMEAYARQMATVQPSFRVAAKAATSVLYQPRFWARYLGRRDILIQTKISR